MCVAYHGCWREKGRHHWQDKSCSYWSKFSKVIFSLMKSNGSCISWKASPRQSSQQICNFSSQGNRESWGCFHQMLQFWRRVANCEEQRHFETTQKGLYLLALECDISRTDVTLWHILHFQNSKTNICHRFEISYFTDLTLRKKIIVFWKYLL